MKASIRTISKLTGFSPATISNALNHKKGVNAATASRIFQVAEQIGYGTESRKTKIRFVMYRKNGLIIDDSTFFSAVIEGAEKQAKEMGYETVLSCLDCELPDFEKQLQMVLADTDSLLIVLGTEMQEEDYEKFHEYKGRIVILDGWSEKYSFDSVLINNTDSACQAVEYLLKKGHQRIGYLRGDYRIKAFQSREYGFYRALDRAGIKEEGRCVVTLGTKLETAYEGMKAYLEKQEKSKMLPTAFFADNDVIAIGAIRALQEKKIKVPDEVSVIGFDDISFGSISDPGLTTIHVYRKEMGGLAVRRLLDYVNYPGSEGKTKIQVCTAFIERGSVREINFHTQPGI